MTTEGGLEDELRSRLEYAPETGLFIWKRGRNTGKTAGSVTSYGYVAIKIKGRAFLAHRLAWLYMKGSLPLLYIDHINGIKEDNVFSNLREVTQSQNSQNVRRVGVRERNKRFDARIMTEGQSTYLGSFGSHAEAYSAYLTAKKELHSVASSHCFKD